MPGTRHAYCGRAECSKRFTDAQEATFGIAVTMLTLGGLAGSIFGDSLTRAFGRTGVFRICDLVFISGMGLIGLSSNLAMLIIGR